MLLRRFIEHLKEQHWTAIGLDFLIVVLGVFIGIQVSNWNEAQAEQRLGAQYGVRLARDLQQNIDGLDDEIAYYTAVREAVLHADALLAADRYDPRTLVINVYRATEIVYTAPVRATWDEIVSSGHLDLLPNSVTETGLSQYFAFDTAQDTYRMGFNSGYRQAVRKIIPMRVQVAIREGCSDVRDQLGNIVGFEEDCELNVTPAELSVVADALRRDSSVAAELRYQYSFAVSAVLNLRGSRVSLEQGLTALGHAPAPAGAE